MEMKKRKLLLILGFAFLTVAGLSMRLKTVTYTVESDKISHSVRIALITDLHGCWYGKEQENLLRAVEQENPDIILLGGDIFDDEVPYEKSEITVEKLAKKYPCYYVSGNHEYWSNDIENILEILKKHGVTILSAACETVQLNGQNINICGVDDPDVVRYTKDGVPFEKQLSKVEEDCANGAFTVLLSHRPEFAETYQEYKFNLVLTGHAHGGQWRIPGILNGLFAPNQGLFPKYAGGRYDFEEQTLIVSRGLARESTFAPRIFNRPELVIIDLESNK